MPATFASSCRRALVAALVLAVAACTSGPQLAAQWTDPQLGNQSAFLRKSRVLVACDVADLTVRQLCQDRVAAEIMQVATDTRRAWVGAVAAREAAKYMEQVKDAAEASAELARRMAAAGNSSKLDQAREQVAQIEQQYRQTVAQAKQAATEAADKAASVISTGALVAFVALVLGAVAGWFGGRSGVVHPVFADGLVPHRRRLA